MSGVGDLLEDAHRVLPPAYALPFARPASWSAALDHKAQHPDHVPLMGGTDLMVELNFARRRPAGLLDLSAVPAIAEWRRDGDTIVLGAGVPYRRIEHDLARLAPALAIAARTVGSPQIRNRGTVGGNLGTASPAGDAHPPLLALGATVVADSVDGERAIPIDEFFVGPKRNSLQPNELIREIRLPAEAGAQQFAKVGARNAMVISTASFAMVMHEGSRRMRSGIGSAGPVPLRARDAEAFADGLDWDAPLDDDAMAHFGELVAAAARPIDDVRGTAEYRRHALAVIAARCLKWCWNERLEETG